MNFNELKLRAKQNMAGNWSLLIAVFVVAGIITGAASSIRGIGSLVVSGPVGVGVCGIYLKLMRGEETTFTDMFDGFRNFVNCFIAGLLSCIIVTVFMLLLIVPGVIKALAYSQAYFILSDNPDMDGWAALKASEQMMMGHKEELFMLYLSFLPWLLLCVFVFPALYVMPYMNATMAEFYDRISNEYVIE